MRWGLLGGSDIAATRMIPAMRALGQPITAVASNSAGRAEAFAGAHAIATATSGVDELLSRDDVDAVYISTTNQLHGPHTLAAAAAGKHVLCEKPVAMDLPEAWSMVAACDRAGVVFGVNHHLPSHTTHTEIRRLVAAGAIGEPKAVRVFFAFELAPRLRGWRLTDPVLGGPILDLLPHVGSVVNKLIGRPLVTTATAVRQGSWDLPVPDTGATTLPEDACMAVIRYEGDVLCQVDVGWSVPFARNGLEVHGTEGSLVARNVMRADPGGTLELIDSAGEREVVMARHQDAYEVTLETFARSVSGDGAPAISGLEGLRALAVALAVRESSLRGRAVTLNLDPVG